MARNFWQRLRRFCRNKIRRSKRDKPPSGQGKQFSLQIVSLHPLSLFNNRREHRDRPSCAIIRSSLLTYCGASLLPPTLSTSPVQPATRPSRRLSVLLARNPSPVRVPSKRTMLPSQQPRTMTRIAKESRRRILPTTGTRRKRHPAAPARPTRITKPAT